MTPENTTVPQPVKIGKFKASKMIVKESWALLRQDKELMWFPVLTSIFSLVALGAAWAAFFFIVLNGDLSNLKAVDDQPTSYAEVIIAVVYYIAAFFIVNFFQACILVIAHARMNGADKTFGDGVRGAGKHIFRIFSWSVISATVGLVFSFISDRSRLFGKVIVGIFGAAWNTLTYFSLPALVIGETNIIGSFKESAATIRKTWGEVVIVHLGVGLFFIMLFFVIILLGIGVVVLLPQAETFIAVIIVLVTLFIILLVVYSVLSTIFKLALFEYARTGKVPQGFSPELIQSAINIKK